MPKESPKPEDLLHRCSAPCRGVCSLEKPRDPQRSFVDSVSLTIPVLPTGQEVQALVSLYRGGVQTVVCELAKEGRRGEVTCDAMAFDDSPLGSRTHARTNLEGWSRSGYSTPCKFVEEGEKKSE